jgi:hypothetical protein
MESSSRPVEGEYLHLNFRVHRDGRVDLLPSFHLPGIVPTPMYAPLARVAVELRGPAGQVFGFYRCHQDMLADPGAPFLDFHEVVPWNPQTVALGFFFDDGDQVQVLELEESAPEMTTRPTMTSRLQKATCRWGARQRDRGEESITYLVRYSNDGGATWRAIAAGLTEPSLATDLDTLPGGERCILQVVASAGIRTTTVETEPFAVEVKPRRAYIVSPDPDAFFREGDSVVLGGLGFSPDFGTATFEETVWTSNIAGFIGSGFEVITHTLARGVHMVRLGVADGLGGETSAQVQINIEPRDTERPLRRPPEGVAEVRLIK